MVHSSFSTFIRRQTALVMTTMKLDAFQQTLKM